MAEKNKGENAKFSLIAISNAEKRYKLDKGQYYDCASPCNITKLNDDLGLLLGDRYFDYSITGNTTFFEATATRKNEGMCAGGTIKVTSDDNTIVAGCNVW